MHKQKTQNHQTRRFFSASRVLGSRPGSVGVGVAGCRGCAWVFNRAVPSAPHTLAAVFPVVSTTTPGSLRYLPSIFPGITVSTRVYQGRCIVRVRGAATTLRAVAAWWSLSFYGASPATIGVIGQGS